MFPASVFAGKSIIVAFYKSLRKPTARCAIITPKPILHLIMIPPWISAMYEAFTICTGSICSRDPNLLQRDNLNQDLPDRSAHLSHV